MDVDMKIFIEFEYTLENSGLLFYSLIRNVKAVCYCNVIYFTVMLSLNKFPREI